MTKVPNVGRVRKGETCPAGLRRGKKVLVRLGYKSAIN